MCNQIIFLIPNASLTSIITIMFYYLCPCLLFLSYTLDIHVSFVVLSDGILNSYSTTIQLGGQTLAK